MGAKNSRTTSRMSGRRRSSRTSSTSSEEDLTRDMSPSCLSNRARKLYFAAAMMYDGSDGPYVPSLRTMIARSGPPPGFDNVTEEEINFIDDILARYPSNRLGDSNPDISKLMKNDVHRKVRRSSGKESDPAWLYYFRPCVVNRIVKREIGLNQQRHFTDGDKCYMASRYLPNRLKVVDHYTNKAFCGSFSHDGDIFITACQDQVIRVYNTAHDKFEQVKSIKAKDVGWSVLDTAFSPDGRYAAYSSWSDCIHLCNLYGDHDINEALPLMPGDYSFCIFSLKFSSDNSEILGGANDGHLYVYDREIHRRTLKIEAHDDDVNTVCFGDDSSQILFSGGDDGLCKVWDRRTLSEEKPLPVGTLAGHTDGITYIDSKGDARFFISNSKDQSMKLWDIRRLSNKASIEETKRAVSSQRWDYRWQQIPSKMYKKTALKGDSSVMTYRGHKVLNTLIRCKFSPFDTTGQRFLYTGCASGNCIVYDLLTGRLISRLPGHNSCVRDVSWHPYQNIIVTTSWDGCIGKWFYTVEDAGRELHPGEVETTTVVHTGVHRNDYVRRYFY